MLLMKQNYSQKEWEKNLILNCESEIWNPKKFYLYKVFRIPMKN